MMAPGSHPQAHYTGLKRDRWLVGIVAGAALAYLIGKAAGLGGSRRAG